MKMMIIGVAIFITITAGSGCATVVTGKYQKINVTSEPPGAKVRTDTGEYILTPGSFNLSRNEDHILVAEYEGCEAQQKTLKHGLQGWFWGNILLGGIVGGVVDLASGASDKLVPNKVHFDFTQSGRIAVNRRTRYLEEHPETKEEIRLAIIHGLAAKGMTKEELVASLGPPDVTTTEGEYEKLTYEKQTPKHYYLKDGILKKTE